MAGPSRRRARAATGACRRASAHARPGGRGAVAPPGASRPAQRTCARPPTTPGRRSPARRRSCSAAGRSPCSPRWRLRPMPALRGSGPCGVGRRRRGGLCRRRVCLRRRSASRRPCTRSGPRRRGSVCGRELRGAAATQWPVGAVGRGRADRRAGVSGVDAARAGRPAVAPAAIRWYGRLRTALRRELGILPSGDTEAIYDECVAGLGITEPAFVGRQLELARATALLRSEPGRRSSARLSCEARQGIGKSALCREVARRGAGRGLDGDRRRGHRGGRPVCAPRERGRAARSAGTGAARRRRSSGRARCWPS